MIPKERSDRKLPNEPSFEEVLTYGQAIRQGDESILEVQHKP
jgi:hypothetical protein